jgi:hypothetical protein
MLKGEYSISPCFKQLDLIDGSTSTLFYKKCRSPAQK